MCIKQLIILSFALAHLSLSISLSRARACSLSLARVRELWYKGQRERSARSVSCE